jgi:2-oxoglutarate ferredoxin oxidoreductase subunit delta
LPATEIAMKVWRTPLDLDEVTIPHGEVVIIRERCKGCGFCVDYCPKEVLVMSEEFNRKGYHPPEVVKAGECVNCNLCEMICPDYAIFCVPLEPISAGNKNAGGGAERAGKGGSSLES